MSLQVRPARTDELEQAGDLVAGAYLADGIIDAETPYLEDLRDAAGRARDSLVLVATEADTIVGTVTWCPTGSTHREVATETEGEFRSLGVAAQARGLGVGRMLVQACLDLARDEGFGAVAVSSEESMAAAHRLYRRLGFVRVPERDWQPAPDVRLHAYRLDLPT